jgi:hypothetical protein
MPLASYRAVELHVTETITFDSAYMASFDKLLSRSVLTSGDCVDTDRDHSTEHPTFSLTHSLYAVLSMKQISAHILKKLSTIYGNQMI